MMNEDFFLRGSLKNMFVISRMQQDETLYFYYPTEHVAKPKDIEPIRKASIQLNQKYELALSRVHRWGLVVWINPFEATTIKQTKPIVTFSLDVHTPFMAMKERESRVNKVHEGRDLDPIEALEWLSGKAIFLAGLRWLKHTDTAFKQLSEYPAVVKEIKEPVICNQEQLFDNASILRNTYSMILIGSQDDIACLESVLLDRSGRMTLQTLEAFLKSLL
jgi:hypothetical protein